MVFKDWFIAIYLIVVIIAFLVKFYLKLKKFDDRAK